VLLEAGEKGAYFFRAAQIGQGLCDGVVVLPDDSRLLEAFGTGAAKVG